MTPQPALADSRRQPRHHSGDVRRQRKWDCGALGLTIPPSRLLRGDYLIESGPDFVPKLCPTQAHSGSFQHTPAYDAVGTSNYDAENRQLGFGARTMTYDNNGNLATLTMGVDTTQYTWDQRNRLSGITATGLAASFVYDGLGRRTSKTINASTAQFLYDGVDVLRETIDGTPVHYLRSLEIDEPFSRGGTEYYLLDALGSAVALTDGSGAVTTSYSYEPFGRTEATGTASGNPFQYTGRENDGTGLYYFRARYYQPVLARFVTEDPIALVGVDINLYGFVGESPLNFVDRLGLDKDNECTFRKRFINNALLTNAPIIQSPLRFTSGLLLSGEFARQIGVPTVWQFARSGFAPIRPFIPVAGAIGVPAASIPLLTAGQSAVVVGGAAGVKAIITFVAFEVGVGAGAAVNAALVQPVFGPILGITGCEGYSEPMN